MINYRTGKIIITIFAVLYLGSYCAVRKQKLLVHTVSYMSVTQDSKKYFHAITIGDIGTPMLSEPKVIYLATFANVAYTPLRIAETFFWKVCPRKYSFTK